MEKWYVFLYTELRRDNNQVEMQKITEKKIIFQKIYDFFHLGNLLDFDMVAL